MLNVYKLDRSNLANAYVSGMRDDLNFQGNQFNQINTVFTVGYVSPVYVWTGTDIL